MCGIYGYLRLDDNAVDEAVVAAMGSRVVHRGPDDEGRYANGACAIGMRRLSIIDLEGGHQPLSNEDGTLWLVANGEIYNFRELRRELAAQGHRFKTGSDCEAILHAYEQYGDDFVARLNGMFAFALWDSRRGRLLVARDRLGVKPLYLRRGPSSLAFASEAKSLLALPDSSVELDPVALHCYLSLGYVPAPHCLFKGIEKLPPASMIVAEGNRQEIRRYWRISSRIEDGVAEDEWIERVRHGLGNAVRMQMVSDVPLGAFLSGGIDSSAVVANMAAHSDRPVKTYAIGFEGGKADAFYNELPYARRVSERFGTEHQEIIVRPDVAALLPRLIWHMDEPIADTAFVTTYLVSEFARRDVTVILSGVGGDELFGGYRRYLGEHYQQYFEMLPGWVRRTAVAVSGSLPSDRHSALLNISRLARGFLAGSELPFEERYKSYVEVFGDREIDRLIRVRALQRPDAIRQAFGFAGGKDALNRMLAVDAETQLPDDLLLLTDKMSMATSLECRVPFLDHELVEMAASMPESVKLRGGRLKHVLKQALAPMLPEDILHRKKRGFGAPMGAWLRDDLAPLRETLLSETAVRSRGFLDPGSVRQLIQEHEQNRIDGTDRIMALLNLEVWARVYLDARAPEDVAEELKAALP
jgi:asparagine synthase (glutamine-hydrolysing)